MRPAFDRLRLRLVAIGPEKAPAARWRVACFTDETFLSRPLCLLLILILPCLPLRAAELVVHHAVSVDSLSQNAARLIFTMRVLRWEDGRKVRVYVLPDSHPVHQEFSKRQLGLYPRQLRRVWDRHLFSGSGSVPSEVASVEEMQRRVAETPGAIGYLPDGFADGTVRIIHVSE